MCELCKRTYNLDEEHHELIRNITHRIIQENQPSHITLFGSFARGEWHEDSDVDLFIVAEKKEQCEHFIKTLSENNEFGLEIEAFVHTPAEHERMLTEQGSFIRRVLSEGVILHTTSNEH